MTNKHRKLQALRILYLFMEAPTGFFSLGSCLGFMVDAIFIDPAVFAFLLGKLDVMVGCHNKRPIPGDFVILTDDFIAGRTLLFVFHKD